MLAAIVVREVSGGRGQPATATVTTDRGLEGGSLGYREGEPGRPASMMNVEVASRIANGQSVALFGDNLFTNLDVGGGGAAYWGQVVIGEGRLACERRASCPM